MIYIHWNVVWVHGVQKSCSILNCFICCLGGWTQSKNAKRRQQYPMCFFNHLENACKAFHRHHEKSAECIQREEEENCSWNKSNFLLMARLAAGARCFETGEVKNPAHRNPRFPDCRFAEMLRNSRIIRSEKFSKLKHFISLPRKDFFPSEEIFCLSILAYFILFFPNPKPPTLTKSRTQ